MGHAHRAVGSAWRSDVAYADSRTRGDPRPLVAEQRRIPDADRPVRAEKSYDKTAEPGGKGLEDRESTAARARTCGRATALKARVANPRVRRPSRIDDDSGGRHRSGLWRRGSARNVGALRGGSWRRFVRARATAHHRQRQERRAREKHPCPDFARSGFVRPTRCVGRVQRRRHPAAALAARRQSVAVRPMRGRFGDCPAMRGLTRQPDWAVPSYESPTHRRLGYHEGDSASRRSARADSGARRSRLPRRQHVSLDRCLVHRVSGGTLRHSRRRGRAGRAGRRPSHLNGDGNTARYLGT
jgi:hypothetical protein